MEKKRRLYWVDLLRGVTIISMILYHAMWDITYIFEHHIMWFYSWKAEVWQQSICIVFIMLSGFCFHYDKHPIKRGVIILLLGFLISLFTHLFMPNDHILFGILTFIGFSILVMSFLDKLKCKLPLKSGIFISLLGFLLFRNIDHGLWGIKGIYAIKLPSFFYQYRILAFLGFPDEKFKSSDYFPFLPWFFLFMFGYYLFFLWEKQSKKIDVKETTLPWIQWIGRKSLVIYMIHQPAIYLLLYGIHALRL